MSMTPETHDDDLLVGDAERREAEERLRDAAVDGRLSLSEFSTRMDTALTARTRGVLRAVTRDLAPVAAVRAVTGRIVAVMSEQKRSGRWRAEGQVDVVAVMGSCSVDLRNAEIIGGEVVLNVRGVMSEVKIAVPSGVAVTLEASSVMGSTKLIHDDSAPLPGAPSVRVRGYSVMSSIEVTSDAALLSAWEGTRS